MPSRPPVVSRRLGRRALLVGTAGTLATVVAGAAGCSADPLDPTPADPTYTPTSGASDGVGASPTGPSEDSDDDLVAQVLGALALAHRTARANARTHPALAPRLRAFERLHRVHAVELGDLPTATGRVAVATDSPAQVLARVERREAALQQTLVDAASSAGSGALAQTFASMAAGVAQLRTTL